MVLRCPLDERSCRQLLTCPNATVEAPPFTRQVGPRGTERTVLNSAYKMLAMLPVAFRVAGTRWCRDDRNLARLDHPISSGLSIPTRRQGSRDTKNMPPRSNDGRPSDHQNAVSEWNSKHGYR